MKFASGVQLISHQATNLNKPTRWADLGCGTGFFTNVLSSMLAKGSTIYAVDTDASAVKKVNIAEGINLETFVFDFTKTAWPFTALNGILLANALHYVKDKNTLAERLKKHFAADGCVLIVEYDTNAANPWVPYPISYQVLKELCVQHSFSSIEKIGEMPSAFGRANLYGALIKV